MSQIDAPDQQIAKMYGAMTFIACFSLMSKNALTKMKKKNAS